jgi:AraC-like DNA-binding protein
MVGMHSRTLQRRLQEEGIRFAAIKDEVCRETALRYLQATRMPLIRVAALPGYSYLPAFSPRCQQWFKRSPSELKRASAVTVDDAPIFESDD